MKQLQEQKKKEVKSDLKPEDKPGIEQTEREIIEEEIGRKEKITADPRFGSEEEFEAFQAFDKDQSAYVGVFWGEGGAFCSGWDLKYASTLSGLDALDPHDFPDKGVPPMALMGPSRLNLSKPIIAAVAGPAVAGGMELALWLSLIHI